MNHVTVLVMFNSGDNALVLTSVVVVLLPLMLPIASA